MDNSALTSQSNECMLNTAGSTSISALLLQQLQGKTILQYLVRKCTVEHYMELELVISRIIRYSVQTAIYVSANKYNISIAESHPHLFFSSPSRPPLKNRLLTGTFFCVTITAESFPRTATDVRPPWFMALKAYSRKIYKC